MFYFGNFLSENAWVVVPTYRNKLFSFQNKSEIKFLVVSFMENWSIKSSKHVGNFCGYLTDFRKKM